MSNTRTVILMAGFLAALGVVGFIVAAMAAGFGLQSQLGSLAGDYYSAIARADGETAYSLLCEEAQQRTNADDLASLAAANGGLRLASHELRGSGPAGVWPWTDRGVGGVRLDVAGEEEVLYIEMRHESTWRVCPDADTSFLGTSPD